MITGDAAAPPAARIPRPGRLALAGLLLALLAAVGIAVGLRAGATARPFDPDSAGNEGLLALRRWLEAMGHPVTVRRGAHDARPGPPGLVLLLPGAGPLDASAVAGLRRGVEGGGTLVLTDHAGEAALIRAFGVGSGAASGGRSSRWLPAGLRQLQPLFPEAPPLLGLHWPGSPVLSFPDEPDRALPILSAAGADPERVTVALQPLGAGRVWHLSDARPLVNAAIADPPGNALVPAFLRALPAGAPVTILAEPRSLAAGAPAGQPSLRDWVLGTAPGRALFLACALLFAYRLWGGLRLGPPLPAPETLQRREAGAFVAAMADLRRRAGLRRAVAEHHKSQLKIALARPWGLDPGLEDTDYLRALAAADPAAPEQLAALERVLRDLDRVADEDGLLRAVAAAEAIRAKRPDPALAAAPPSASRRHWPGRDRSPSHRPEETAR